MNDMNKENDNKLKKYQYSGFFFVLLSMALLSINSNVFSISSILGLLTTTVAFMHLILIIRYFQDIAQDITINN